MDANDYFWKTKKRPPKNKPRAKPLPKAKEKYLEAEEDFEQSLIVLEIKYEKKFQFKSTKQWVLQWFDWSLLSATRLKNRAHYRLILIEQANG